MCNNHNNKETGGCKCLAEILEVIVILQKNADCDDNCIDTCDRGFLGNISRSFNYNTRPVQLFTCGCNGAPWDVP